MLCILLVLCKIQHVYYRYELNFEVLFSLTHSDVHLYQICFDELCYLSLIFMANIVI
jgi:hypothetical protein